MIANFPHKAPEGYYYEYEQFNSRIVSIWLCFSGKFSYNNNEPIRTIWGFYCPKKREYYAPVNAKKVGQKVEIRHTRNWTSMPLALNPLESAFV